jgi:uncharacterized protein (DUF2141 family)
MVLLIKRNIYLFSFFAFIGQNINAQLIVEITNIKEIKGRIEIGLYNDPEVFLSKTEQYKVILVPVDDYTLTAIFDSIPEGKFAISLMHDLNEDGEMERNIIGFPKEPYGFSTNFRPRFGKPGFEDAEFYYDGKFIKLTIELVH